MKPGMFETWKDAVLFLSVPVALGLALWASLWALLSWVTS